MHTSCTLHAHPITAPLHYLDADDIDSLALVAVAGITAPQFLGTGSNDKSFNYARFLPSSAVLGCRRHRQPGSGGRHHCTTVFRHRKPRQELQLCTFPSILRSSWTQTTSTAWLWWLWPASLQRARLMRKSWARLPTCKFNTHVHIVGKTAELLVLTVVHTCSYCGQDSRAAGAYRLQCS
eukprot:1147316-Pelagomonas_calceolata.AAC.4